ncbi:hypothetical protein [Sphingopyxis sp. R3-92]|uniref:hypothetical protein n=1 Tax=Sphingopyxis sp. R3-92 TaxID=3158553 RepID=UPI003EE4EBC0
MAGVSLAALALSLAGAVPAWAQDSETQAPTRPSSRPMDFRLPPADDGRSTGVQGPSDNGLPPLAPGERRGQPTPAPAPAPQIAPPRVAPTQPAPSTATPAPTRREAPAPTAPAQRAAPAPAADSAAPPPATGGAEAAPVDNIAPPATALPSPPPSDDSAPVSAPASGEGGTPFWVWLLAGLAAIGAAIWYWRRRPVPVDAVSPEEFEAPAPVAPRPAARAVTPVQPRPATPAPPRPAPPRPATPAVQAPSVPSTSMPSTPAPLVTRPVDEQRAMVAMSLQIHAIRLTAEQVAVSFTLDLTNEGAVAATGLMIRIALGQGSAMPEAVLARFFDGAGGSVLRDDIMLAPGESDRVSSDVLLSRAAIDPLMIGGKPMLIPVLAFDVTYHWEGTGDAFGQSAASFVLGRAPAPGAGDKLAPLPLDRPSWTIDLPGARPTAIRRRQ